MLEIGIGVLQSVQNGAPEAKTVDLKNVAQTVNWVVLSTKRAYRRVCGAQNNQQTIAIDTMSVGTQNAQKWYWRALIRPKRGPRAENG